MQLPNNTEFVWVVEYRDFGTKSSHRKDCVLAFVTRTRERAIQLMKENQDYGHTKTAPNWYWALTKEPLDLNPLEYFHRNELEYFNRDGTSPLNQDSEADVSEPSNSKSGEEAFKVYDAVMRALDRPSSL